MRKPLLAALASFALVLMSAAHAAEHASTDLDLSATWIGIPERFPFFVDYRLEVLDRALLRVEICDEERVSGFGEIVSPQELAALERC